MKTDQKSWKYVGFYVQNTSHTLFEEFMMGMITISALLFQNYQKHMIIRVVFFICSNFLTLVLTKNFSNSNNFVQKLMKSKNAKTRVFSKKRTRVFRSEKNAKRAFCKRALETLNLGLFPWHWYILWEIYISK